VLPAPLRGDRHDIPQLGGHTKDDLASYKVAAKAHEAVEELRLGYVAYTRARHRLSVSSHWRPYRGQPIGPSRYQQVVVDCLASWGQVPEPWAPEPDEEARALLAAGPAASPWPVTEQTAEALRRIEGAELVAEARRDLGPHGTPSVPDDLVLASRVAEWDDELERLVAEATRDRRADQSVQLPTSLSATALARLRDDPDGFARDLARPMPRPPSSAARFGTRFHAWVEARFGQQDLFDYGDLPGRADAGIDDDTDLKELIATFESGPFASRVPHAVEAPFALVLGGQVVRGRIDAVYADQVGGDAGFLVVDWKTSRARTADPLQLAIYRQAWAEVAGIPVEQVRAVFYYVRSGEIDEPENLADRAELESILTTQPA
jgi:DNA helicase-2/ATP-dependent DNA helicase PcrA